jgi:hypothetical protein
MIMRPKSIAALVALLLTLSFSLFWVKTPSGNRSTVLPELDTSGAQREAVRPSFEPGTDTTPVAVAEPAPPAAGSSPPVRLVGHAWTLLAPTEGVKLDPTGAAVRVAAMTGRPIRGRSALASGLPAAQMEGLRQGDSLQVSLLGGGSTVGYIHFVGRDDSGWIRVGGALSGQQKGSFVLAAKGRASEALLQLPEEGLAYTLELQRDGKTLLVEKPLSQVICHELPKFQESGAEPADTIRIQAVPPILSSRPSATAVIYLDFDGETVTDPAWNNGVTIVAEPSPLTETQITEVWNRVKEDYLPFDVDVTTDLTRYQNAPIGRRMRCIITPTTTARPDVGGVAILNSFARAGTGFFSPDIPCWVFNATPRSIADTVSHEVGHTFGLRHDGQLSPVDAYYEGHGSGATSWGPIMGLPYLRELSQWSKGEYAGADETQDDVAIITGPTNGIGYVSDEAGGSRESAVDLPAPNGVINHSGIITQASDADFYAFNVAAGPISILALPAAVGPNLDLLIELLDSEGTVLVSSNPDTALNANITYTGAAGLYYLKVQGTGRGDVLGSGYSSYGSIGAYRLSGTLPGAILTPVVNSLSSVSGFVGQALSFQITATNNPTTYTVTTGALPAGLSLNATTGEISGVPTQSGVSTVTIGAGNVTGVGTRAMTFSISRPVTLVQALDLPDLVWTTSGDQPWIPQTITSSDEVDAAQSGPIGGGQTSNLKTTLVGPITLSFRWRTDSERGYDFLRVYVDNVAQGELSGRTQWVEKSISIPSGSHEVEWRYRKDNVVNEGLDTAWVDALVILPPLLPTFTSAAAVAGTVGQPFTYQMAGTNSPNRFHLLSGDLPAGLSLNPATGVVSGTPQSVQTSTVVLGATNVGGTGMLSVTISISPTFIPLDVALDTSDRVWTAGGDAPFFGQTPVTFDGVDAVRSGAVTHQRQSWMETTVTGPAVISFRWRVDSDEGADFLSVLDNGVTVASISGLTEWATRTLSVTAGVHTVRWAYQKDASRSVGEDAGWVDAVTVTSESTRILALTGDLVFGSVPVGETPTRVLTLANTGNAPLTVQSITYPAGYTGAFSGVIGPGESREVTVVFSPTTARSYLGVLTVNGDLTAGARTKTVSGTGTVPPPANDGFAAAIVLEGSEITVASSNAGATRETGEPRHDGFTGGKSVWWKWTAPASGTVAVNTIGSAFDTVLAVYTGATLENLVALASDDEGGGDATSSLTFNTTSGTTYFIAVDGYFAASGSVTLHLTQLPPTAGNNMFLFAANLTGTTAQAIASNSTATREPGEPAHGGQATGRSLWWTWTAPSSGRLLVNTNGSRIYTILAVYSGNSLFGLTPLGFNLQSGVDGFSFLSVPVEAGTVYRIAVDGFSNNAGLIILNLTLVDPPPGDRFADAVVLTGTDVRTTATSRGASKEVSEPEHAAKVGGSSIWWRWTAPADYKVSLTTAGSAFDTVLAVYTGAGVDALTPVASNDNSSAFTETSTLAFNATAGTVYHIAVDDLDGIGGAVSLSLTASTPPPNDDFASALPLQGAAVTTTGTNRGATRQSGEPSHAGTSGSVSVWWQWSTPISARVSLTTAGSDIDTLLGVYRGAEINALTTVASNDDGGLGGEGSSAVTFTATADTTYWIAVDGYLGETGAINLSLKAEAIESPVITRQPASLTLPAGRSAYFVVTATGTGPLSYQWRKGGVDLTGATTSAYAIGETELANAGDFSVVVTNTYGTVTSEVATLVVTPGPVRPGILTHPAPQTVSIGQAVSLGVTADGTGPLAYQWFKDAVPVTGATGSTLVIGSVGAGDAGLYSVVVTNAAGSTTSTTAALTVSSTPVAPVILVQPANRVVAAGESTEFVVVVSGSAPFTYQWRKDGVVLGSASGATLSLTAVQAANAGAYSVVVGNASGTTTSAAAVLTVVPAVASRISNVSVRATLAAAQTLTVGFTMTGGAKPIVVRAVGPGLAAFGVPGTMPDPKLALFNGSTQVDSNDNWAGLFSLNEAFATVGAFPLAPNSFDAALLRSIEGGRTLQVNGGAGGNVLVEAYDSASGNAIRFVNVSSRSHVGVGADILVAGFTVLGTAPKTVLVRAIGPALGAFGVPNVLADPKLEVYSGSNRINGNDNWPASLLATFAQVGAFQLPLLSKDSAIVLTLAPGGYTVQVSGADGGTGEGLVEIYEVQP